MTTRALPASFRDPSGFLYRDEDGQLFRQINRCYQADFEALLSSGLYDALTRGKFLVAHVPVDSSNAVSDDAFAVIRPQLVPFISYPYEWSFSMLRDAALLTLSIQRKSIEHGMSLKDASAYNVQFIGCRPIFIDTLSFKKYVEGQPWVAYGQFCRHFLAPLMLMSHTSVDLGRLMELYIDGIPLDLTSKLLPWKTRLSVAAQLHLHMHAKMLRKHESTSAEQSSKVGKLTKKNLLLLLDNLQALISSLTWKAAGTEWADYTTDNTYTEQSAQTKCDLVRRYLADIAPATVWDLGANTGEYSRLAVEQGAYCCSCDIDPACVERNYLSGKKQGESRLLPLRVDLANPSPALGWAHDERGSLADRGPADAVMALALIHHLAISNNVPLAGVAKYFHRLGNALIIEWVPKSDVQVQRLLRSRKDIFDAYDQTGFEASFGNFFDIIERQEVGNGGRVLYHMAAKDQWRGAEVR